jgi:uncharacterized membrane protein YkoI
MSQRIALFTSVALTAFVLVFIGAAIGIGRLAQDAVTPTLDPLLLAQLQAREATYQAMIAQANAQLQATDPQPTPTTAPTPTQEPAVVYPISPDMAAYLALSIAPGSYLIKNPELVSFQGAIAYEVTLNSGRMYVDANNGQILFNGAAAITSAGGSGSSAGGGENDEGD